ncbi:hypothetical protein GIB67_035586 [Kingdonia uniflora]|uniref:Mechanosensitive ion channel protein n=1 Tax=Kingdonia uniflora TaxID=39325 RepID=A0A7J7LDD0_9MAGN|nr:hypothetical protein GIB67_035586 [Kingdonia uniflora]
MEGKERSSTKGEVVLIIKEAKKGEPEISSISSTSTKDSEKPRVEMSTFIINSPNRPPKIPQQEQTTTLTQRKSFARSEFSKPKSRFEEPNDPITTTTLPIGSNVVEDQQRSPNINIRTIPITPKTSLLASPGGGDLEEDEEIYKSGPIATELEKKRKKFKVRVLVEWVILVCILGLLLATLFVDKLQHFMIWGLESWKWCVLLLVIVSGHLMSNWIIHILVWLIERNFLLRKKVLYFVYGLKKSVHVCIWFCLVLLTWLLLFNHGVKRTKSDTKILNGVSRALASFLVGAVIWLGKTLFLKILASSFHVNTFFDRIQESIFHQYVLQTLSGPPVMELAERIGGTQSMGQLSFRNVKKGKKGEEQEVIDVSKLHKMKQEKVSAWTMKGLINVISNTGLTTISNTIDQLDYERGEQKDKEITSEWEAKAAAYRIFRNVAKQGSKYIDEDDLLRFLNKEEVRNVMPLFAGAAETGKIKKSVLRNWVVKVYLERKSLAHSLNDTKTAVKQLNNIMSAVILIVIIIVGLLITGIATVQVFVFISSQTLLIAFMFGNTAKTIFEAIIFVFVMHPFDVGDRCVIDGVQMIVEEMNILTTVFLRYDNEKIYYPNTVLATKPISNFYRSPDMGDTIEFSVDVSTSMENIGALKSRIKMYVESKPQHWKPNHTMVVREIENVNKMKMALFVNHTMNYQNMLEKIIRKSDLVIEMKKIFEELSIKYHLLPQEVQLINVGSTTTLMTASHQ